MMKLSHRLFIAAALLCTGSLALAAPDHDHGRGDHDRGRHGYDRRYDDDRRWHDRDDRRYGYYRGGPRYYGHPRWERGRRFYGPSYVVRDYGYYRLRPPPYGYHWVRANNDYLLVAIATGVILDMALR
jgi:Ni/Co efflux regulator RcnB